ncbi:YraN family protein [Patescibacteria group bacterium]|nr:YraN family protein [Patescibacteria group bacterium]
MKNTKKIGDLGEEGAVRYLKKKGFEIVERNFRTRFGEIDIIAIDEDMLVFVEVKVKRDEKFGDPGEMIDSRKIEKIKRTANYFLQEKDLCDIPWRIDAVLIRGDAIEHIECVTY